MNYRNFAAIVVLLLSTGRLAAHDPGLSTLQAVSHPSGQVDLTFTFAQPDVEAALTAAEGGSPQTAVEGEALPQESLQRLAERLVVPDAGQAGLPPAVRFLEARWLEAQDGINVVFRFSLHHGSEEAASPQALRIQVPLLSQLPRGHRLYATSIDAEGRQTSAALLHAGNNFFELPPDVGSGSTQSGAWHFFSLGVEHIVTGYDHLLFLLALLIIGLSYKESAKIITAFTLAHSLTLVLAVVGAVRLPAGFVEPMIAASIVYVGLENLVRHPSSHSRWLIAFAFGLIHGLGFASILLEIGVGQGPSVLLPLLTFNLGVEAGQLAVMVLVLPAIHSLRSRPVALLSLTRAGSAAVIAAGLFWLVSRTVL